MEADTNDIKYEIYRIAWSMRGGVSSYDLYHAYSHEDRKIMTKIIQENIDISRKNQMVMI